LLGAYAYDFNVRIASGVDPQLVAGAQVWFTVLEPRSRRSVHDQPQQRIDVTIVP
jgi:hypothetical protein